MEGMYVTVLVLAWALLTVGAAGDGEDDTVVSISTNQR
jgi:hypothetical protein